MVNPPTEPVLAVPAVTTTVPPRDQNTPSTEVPGAALADQAEMPVEMPAKEVDEANTIKEVEGKYFANVTLMFHPLLTTFFQNG